MAKKYSALKEKILVSLQTILQKRGYALASSLSRMRLKQSMVFDRVDYIRMASLTLVAQKIAANKVKGNVAELGVFRGEFGRNINALFPDKKYYLFDTFEGFDQKDVSIEASKNYSKAGANDFSNTSVDLVLAQMPYPQNCIVKKGYFPATTEGVRDTFAFVNIDPDLYKPVYDGLHFFYPLLEPGGYIFVHDFNNPVFVGANDAVCQFSRETGVNFFPLCDGSGSAVFMR